MKMLQTTVLALATASLLSVSAQAAVNYAGQPYIGAKVGQYSPDDVEDDAVSYGVYGGYKFTPEFGVEAEYLTTSDTDAYEDRFEKTEYSANVLGLYATYDYVFPTTALYAKGRLGVAKNEIDVDYKDKVFNTSTSESFSDTGVAGGLGLGYNFNPMVSAEVMYNFYPTIDLDDGEDLDSNGVTLGAHFKF
ncbi:MULTISPECIES: porin family protein [unclassified Psychrobacter]|uniref:porin family protein n=1 Tax=unclassified Psychrobacter TaxID=196806 RepID=UPI0009A7CB5A|nr:MULTISPECIES: porin family protein [unclassified Psychrobacter]MDE4455804.1 porin family protein [Psychrobacter sp. DAB_AL62B]SLJ85967.1 OmpA domain-containing protein [Psychrobacter sp. DAB_AL43B]